MCLEAVSVRNGHRTKYNVSNEMVTVKYETINKESELETEDV